MRLPINPNNISLQISALSPFTKSSENFYKKEIKKFEKLDDINQSPDICITDRGEKKDNFIIFNSPKLKNLSENRNNNIFDIDSFPIVENYNYYEQNENEIIDNDLKDKIINELILAKKLADFHLGFFNNLSDASFKRIQPNILYNVVKNSNKILSLLKIFYIYEKYNTNNYLLKKLYFKKWKLSVNFIDSNISENVHIINKFGHCISAKNIVIKEIRCGIHPEDENNCNNCFCLRIITRLKRILLRHYYLKKINARKYYLFKWYKNSFKKIRPLYLIS